MIKIPHLGVLHKDVSLDLLQSQRKKVSVLGDIECEFFLDGYEEDERKDDYHSAISNFLSIDESALKQAQDHIYQYYKDIFLDLEPGDDWYIQIETPEDVWQHIKFGNSPLVSRREHGDGLVYISLECFCEWEQEHGLEIVFREGKHINKIGPFNGHLTNSDAYDDDRLEHVIYRGYF